MITDRGRASHVLLSMREYQRLVADQRDIVDWLSVDDDVDLPVERVELSLVDPELRPICSTRVS